MNRLLHHEVVERQSRNFVQSAPAPTFQRLLSFGDNTIASHRGKGWDEFYYRLKHGRRKLVQTNSFYLFDTFSAIGTKGEGGFTRARAVFVVTLCLEKTIKVSTRRSS